METAQIADKLRSDARSLEERARQMRREAETLNRAADQLRPRRGRPRKRTRA